MDTGFMVLLMEKEIVCEQLNKQLCPILRAAGLTRWTLRPAGGHFGTPGKETSSIIEELLAAKKSANRRENYRESLKGYLDRFAQGRGDLASVTTNDIEVWLANFPNQNSRKTWMTRLATLFSFAKRKGYIEKNPITPIDRVTIDRKPPQIVTIEQSRTLVDRCPDNCKPYLVLGMYAGIRPEEIQRIDWSHICFETGTVRVDGKTRRSRIVTLEPIAVNLLEPYRKPKGPVAPSKGVLRGWKRRSRALLGGKWTADILRHTYASYAIAKIGDEAKVAKAMGNSPDVLFKHYYVPVTEQAGKDFFTPAASQSPQLFFEGFV